MKQIVSLGIAIIFSFFLFAVMNLLIENDAKAMPRENTPVVDIHMHIDDSDLAIKKHERKIPKIKPLEKQPKVTKTQTPQPMAKPIKVAIAAGTVAGFKPDFNKNITLDATGIYTAGGNNGDSALMPRIRIEPMYPNRAAREGKQGYVTLSFDINATGDPVNVKVVESKPRGYFESSARKALQKWKYNPKKEDGKAVSVFNQSITLEFKLEG